MSRLGPPTYSQRGDSFRFTWEDAGIQVEFDRFQDKSEGIYAEILAASIHDAGKPSLLHASRMNLLSPTARGSVARALAARGMKVDWGAALEQACFLAVQKYREGEPTVDLREVDPFERPRWLIKPYLEHGGPTVLFAPGGTGKTYLASAIAVTAASGNRVVGWLHGEPFPVLFLDWETDRWTHAGRLNAICTGARIKERPPVYYRHMVAPLSESVAAARKEIDRLNAGMVVIDSLGAACGGELESAETIIKCFSAIRLLGVPALVVSHVTKATARGDNGGHRLSPFGSIYTENLARNTWSIHRAGDEDSDATSVALIHEKTNNGRYQKRHAFNLNFINVTDDQEEDTLVSLEIKAVALSEVPDFDTKQPLKDRILGVLGGGSLTVQDIATRLGVPDDQVRARLRDLREASRVVQLADKRYGLLHMGGVA